MSNFTHREICEIGARFLFNNEGGCLLFHKLPYVTIEPISTCKERPDVFAFNFGTSYLLEAKVSLSDFYADLKKPFRVNQDDGVGHERYYICPYGLIPPDKLPPNWGLLYVRDDGVVELVKVSMTFKSNVDSERALFHCILRKEKIKNQIFNFNKKAKDECKRV